MLIAVLGVLFAMFSIQFGASFAKEFFAVMSPIGVCFLRIWFAALILWIVFRPWEKKLNKAELKLLIFYGASLGLMNLTFYIALQRVPLGIAVALEFAGPLLLSILSSRKAKDFLWILLAVGGLALILPLRQTSLHSIDLTGAIFSLIAGGFWALYIFFGSKVGQRLSGTVAASYGMLIAALTVTPFFFFITKDFHFSPSDLINGFFIALLSSAIPYSLEMMALKKIPSKNFGILMSLEPVIASLSGFVMLHEVLTMTQLLAVVLIVSASLGTVLGIKRI